MESQEPIKKVAGQWKPVNSDWEYPTARVFRKSLVERAEFEPALEGFN